MKNQYTKMAAMDLIYRTVCAMDNGRIPVSVFLDLSKAFDILDHNILPEKSCYHGLNETT